MIGAYESPAEREHSAEAWHVLAWGRPAPLPDEPVKRICPVCDGVGAVGRFAGHGVPLAREDCRQCDGDGEINEGEL